MRCKAGLFSRPYEPPPPQLLLHLDSAGGFSDSSGNSNDGTANGNAQIDTAVSKFGGASCELDGTGDYISLTLSIDWDADFTVELWIRASQSSGSIFAAGNIQSGVGGLHIEASGGSYYLGDAEAISVTGGTVAVDEWQHIALVRNGSTNTLYVDGVDVASDDFTFPISNSTVTIGGAPNYANYFTGHIDEVRVTQAAVYQGNFTPPTAAFPDP